MTLKILLCNTKIIILLPNKDNTVVMVGILKYLEKLACLVGDSSYSKVKMEAERTKINSQ